MKKIIKILSIGLFALFILSGNISTMGQETPSNTVLDIAWKPDGTMIALATSEDLKVIDITSNTIQAGFDINDFIISVDWSPDGNTILSGRRNGTIDIWDANLGLSITSFIAHPGENARLSFVRWNPNGTRFASTSTNIHIPTLRIWDSNTYTIQSEFRDAAFSEVLWSPNGSQIFAANLNGGIYNFDSNLSNYNGVGFYDRVLSIAVDSSGNKIASSSSLDRNIHIWEISTNQLLHVLSGHTDAILSMSWSSQANSLASISLDGTVRIWNTNTGQQTNIINVGTPAYTVAWSPDGTELAYGGENGVVEIIDAPNSCDHSIIAGDVSGLVSAVNSANADPDATRICDDE